MITTKYENVLELNDFLRIVKNLLICLFNKVCLDLDNVINRTDLTDIAKDYIRQNMEDTLRNTHEIWFKTINYYTHDHTQYWTDLAQYIWDVRARIYQPYTTLKTSGEVRERLLWYANYAQDTCTDIERRIKEIAEDKKQ